MEDIRIGRRTRSSFSYVTVAITATPLVKANPNRVSLIVGVPGTNQIVIGPDDSVTTTRGLAIYNTAGPFKFTIQKDGDWITRDIYAISAAGVTCGVIEGILNEK